MTSHVRPWQLNVALDAHAGAPLFLQIARAIADDVDRGRLRPGDVIPGSRTLARTLEVHRNTVLMALDELRAQGVVRMEPARGTVIAELAGVASTHARDRRARAHGAARAGRRADRAGFDLPRLLSPWEGLVKGPPGTLALQSGVPDLRLLPVDEVARAWRRAIRRHGRQLLAYADPGGHPALRRAVAEMLKATRGILAEPEQILIVRGSQMGLDLCARLLALSTDDTARATIAVDELGYPPAWRAFLAAGAQLLPVRVDRDGLDVDALAAHVDAAKPGARVRAILTTPHHQYPTTVSLSTPRRRALLALCARERIALIEDDYDHELAYEGKPLLPLASADTHGMVIYIGTLSKIVAPGLRLGFVCAAPDVIEKLAALRAHTDRQGDLVLEEAVAELIEDGSVLRHARRLKRAGHERRDALASALTRTFGDALRFHVPRGGMALWAELCAPRAGRTERARADAVEAWAERALAAGVAFATARRYALDGAPRPFVRLGFAALDPDEIRAAVRRMALGARSWLG